MVKELSGFSNVEIFDILYKIEQLCSTVKDPDSKTIDAVLYAWEYPRAIRRMDGTFHHLVDYTYNLRLYSISYPITFLSLFRNNYYFKTAHNNQAMKFNKKNILKSFKHTRMEAPVLEFLKEHRLKKRTKMTNRFLILKHIEDIEHQIK